MEHSTERTESGVLLFDTTLRPIASDSGAESVFRGTNGDSAGGPRQPDRIPEELLEAIRRWHSADHPGPHVSVSIRGRRYRCRLYNIVSDNPALAPEMIAVQFDSDIGGGDQIRRLASEYHLTCREGEALRCIALGLSTKEMADRMAISPNTVKAFVRLIMIKLGVTSRAAIMVKLLEGADGD